jgi:hypothetical protein
VDTLYVVQGLSEAFAGVHDALVGSGNSSRDPEIAKELKEGTERFLALTKVAHQETSGNDVEELSEQELGEPVAGTLASSSASMSEGSSELRGILWQPSTTTQ